MTEAKNQGSIRTSDLSRSAATDPNPIVVSVSEANLQDPKLPPPLPPRWKPLVVPPPHLDEFIDLPLGAVVDDLYEVDTKLGSGGMGEIYAARHVRLGKRVAIKVIGSRLSGDAAAMERFAAEARTLARIQHPAIVAVEHVGELSDGRTYFVMEYLRGESLFDRMSRGHIPLPEALCIIDQIARALEAAHTCGVVHRDLKPENVFLVYLPGETPIIKLLDFGLAKLVANVEHPPGPEGRDDRRARQTQRGVAAGTPRYMSPEQMRGDNVDHRADIYALGCVAYELLLGTPPFPHARTLPEFYAAHLNAAPLLPRSVWPEIPLQIERALLALLAKDPTFRPTLAQTRSIVAALRRSELSRSAKMEIAEQRTVKARSRGLTITAVALTILVGGVLIRSVVTARAADGLRSEPAQPPIPPITARPTMPMTTTQVPIEWKVPAETVPPVTAWSATSPSLPQTPMQTPIEWKAPAKTVDTQPPAKPETKRKHRVQAPRSADNARQTLTPQLPPRASNPTTAAPTTSADNTTEKPTPESKASAPIDRNQTMNPFAKKPKVTP